MSSVIRSFGALPLLALPVLNFWVVLSSELINTVAGVSKPVKSEDKASKEAVCEKKGKTTAKQWIRKLYWCTCRLLLKQINRISTGH
jgi:hypothetical protein